MSEPFDLAQLYRDVEDHLVVCLRLSMAERVLYYHLLRHSLLEGQPFAKVSKRRLCRGLGCAFMTVHRHLRLLEQKGCLRVHERGRSGHTIEVLIPQHILSRRADAQSAPRDLAALDCFRSDSLRAAILRRENHACFYCLRQLRNAATLFDHVVPASAGGDNSYHNIVACCFECNSCKKDLPASHFLRMLLRADRLSPAEFQSRLEALEALTSDRLLPKFGPFSPTPALSDASPLPHDDNPDLETSSPRQVLRDTSMAHADSSLRSE
jgi:hypothetical protein